MNLTGKGSHVTKNPPIVHLDFRALLEAAPDGIAVVDDKGLIVLANDRLCELFGYEEHELLNRRIHVLIPDRLRQAHVDHQKRYFDHPAKRPMGAGLPLVGVRKDGEEIPVEISLSPIASGGRSFAIAAVRDISEQKSLREQEASLRTILETEQERHRIGMDLHDGIMQDIYAVSLCLDIAEEDVDNDPPQARMGIQHAVDQLHNVIRDIRSYIFDLRPRRFTGDLGSALMELGREFQDNSSILTDVTVGSDLPVLDHHIAIALYVIAHEALSNTRKYARASTVSIRLYAEGGSLHLEVRDDGLGFDTATEISEEHRGLRNMASRASLAGGDLRVDSNPGEGTLIQVEIGSKVA